MAWKFCFVLPLDRDEKNQKTKPQSVFRIPADLQFDSVISCPEIGKRNGSGQKTPNLFAVEPSGQHDLRAAYRNRWSIEAFFKQIKQTLQLADFLGHSANAVRWQVWTALLVYSDAIDRTCPVFTCGAKPVSMTGYENHNDILTMTPGGDKESFDTVPPTISLKVPSRACLRHFKKLCDTFF